MFFKSKDIEDLRIEKDELRKQVRALKEEKLDLEHQKKLEIEEIKHLNRLAQEKRDIELEREKSKVREEYLKKQQEMLIETVNTTSSMLKQYHADSVAMLQKHNTEMKDVTTSVYKDIIARLPNVNVTMKR